MLYFVPPTTTAYLSPKNIVDLSKEIHECCSLATCFKKGYTCPIYMHPCYCLLLHIPHIHTHATCIYTYIHTPSSTMLSPVPRNPCHNCTTITNRFHLLVLSSLYIPILCLRFHSMYMYIHIYIHTYTYISTNPLCIIHPVFMFWMIANASLEHFWRVNKIVWFFLTIYILCFPFTT
jgi:hypothetical protein